MKIDSLKMFVSDFDGTLADDNSIVSKNAVSELHRLGEIGVVRILATGRSLFSLKTVVDDFFPIDYLVFSSGIGVFNWQTKQLLHENFIDSLSTELIYNFLVLNNYDFMVQLPVPNNHFFHHISSGKPNSDFEARIKYYESHGVEKITECPHTASQFVIICNDNIDHLKIISGEFSELKVVKATSPLDRKSIWIEVLPIGVSKASGIEFLRELLNAKHHNIVSVGNDYYDLDMLNYASKNNAFVVENAPIELKSEFNVIESNNDDGVAKLIKSLY